MKLTPSDLEDWADDGEVFVQSQADMEHAHCLRSASEHLVLSVADRNPNAIQGRGIIMNECMHHVCLFDPSSFIISCTQLLAVKLDG